MALLRETGGLDQYPYLAGLGLDPDDAGRLDVTAGTADHAGFYVDAASGESRLLQEGDPVPDGVWVAQRDIDTLRPGPGTREEPHGFGEGWGRQGEQLGGDRSYAEEDAGGTRRAPRGEFDERPVDPAATQ